MFVMNEETRVTFLESETMAAEESAPKGLIRVTNTKAAALAIANDGVMPRAIPVEALSNDAFLSADVVDMAKREISATKAAKAERQARVSAAGIADAFGELGLDVPEAPAQSGAPSDAFGPDLAGLAARESADAAPTTAPKPEPTPDPAPDQAPEAAPEATAAKPSGEPSGEKPASSEWDESF